MLAFKHAENGVPDLVVCEPHQKLGAAIELMQRYGISQLPVVRNAPAETLADVIGSLNERVLLDRVFRNPDALGEEVAAAMQPPLARGRRWATRSTRSSPTCAARTRRSSSPATAGPQAVLTRSDLLEYLAHRR